MSSFRVSPHITQCEYRHLTKQKERRKGALHDGNSDQADWRSKAVSSPSVGSAVGSHLSTNQTM